MAPLVSVILSTLIVYLTKADKHGVQIVKHIKGGLNPSSAHQLQLSGQHVGEAAKIGLITALVALTVSYSYSHKNIKRTFEVMSLPFFLKVTMKNIYFRKPLPLVDHSLRLKTTILRVTRR